MCGNGLVGGSWFRVLVRRREVRSTRLVVRGERELWFVRSFVRSFVVVVREEELALSAAGVCRGDTCRQDTRCRRNPREVPFSFISFHIGVCVCREASSSQVVIV